MRELSSKSRAFLRSLATKEQSIFHLGKAGLTPEFTKAVDEALAARELVKIDVLNNCPEEPRDVGETLAGRTRSFCFQVIGRKICLYRKAASPKIILPE